MAVAHLAHGFEVARHGREHTGGCAAHGFSHKGDHAAFAVRGHGAIQLVGQSRNVGSITLALGLLPVRITGRDMGGINQNRSKRRTAPSVAANCQRTQGVAVIALSAGDKPGALRLALVHKILPRHLQRGFHRLGATTDEIDLRIGRVQAAGGRGNQQIRQLFGDAGGEEAGVRVGDLLNLRVHGGAHVRVAVAQARDGCAARGVDVDFALRVG